MKELIFEVFKIKGKYVYEEGNRMVIKVAEIDFKRIDTLCIHAPTSLMYYAVELREDADLVKLGLLKEEDYTYLQSLDLDKPYIEDGTIMFSVSLAECMMKVLQ